MLPIAVAHNEAGVAADYADQVKVELLLQVPAKDNQIRYARLTTIGEVLRQARQGFAVRFDDDCQSTH